MCVCAPPTGEAEGGGPVRQALGMDGVGVGTDVVASSRLLVNSDRTSSGTQQTPADPEQLVGPGVVELRPRGHIRSASFYSGLSN